LLDPVLLGVPRLSSPGRFALDSEDDGIDPGETNIPLVACEALLEASLTIGV
jgi:hypothetical protein